MTDNIHYFYSATSITPIEEPPMIEHSPTVQDCVREAFKNFHTLIEALESIPSEALCRCRCASGQGVGKELKQIELRLAMVRAKVAATATGAAVMAPAREWKTIEYL